MPGSGIGMAVVPSLGAVLSLVRGIVDETDGEEFVN